MELFNTRYANFKFMTLFRTNDRYRVAVFRDGLNRKSKGFG